MKKVPSGVSDDGWGGEGSAEGSGHCRRVQRRFLLPVVAVSVKIQDKRRRIHCRPVLDLTPRCSTSTAAALPVILYHTTNQSVYRGAKVECKAFAVMG